MLVCKIGVLPLELTRLSLSKAVSEEFNLLIGKHWKVLAIIGTLASAGLGIVGLND